MDRITCMTIGMLLLLGVIVVAAGKKDEINGKKRETLSCGPIRSANGGTSLPKDDNNGNGCTHQSVSAALLSRVKRDRTHGC